MKWRKNSLACDGAQQAVQRIRIDYVTLHLRPSQWQILSRIIWNSTYHALEKMQVRRSCFALRQYFRDAFGYHISTISSITGELVQLGLISKVQLRPINGQYQCCMYKLQGKIWDIVKSIITYLISTFNRDARRRHKDTNTVNKIHLNTTEIRSKTAYNEKVNDNWLEEFMNRRPDIKKLAY
jgi:hypothetical protein